MVLCRLINALFFIYQWRIIVSSSAVEQVVDFSRLSQLNHLAFHRPTGTNTTGSMDSEFSFLLILLLLFFGRCRGAFPLSLIIDGLSRNQK